MPPAAEPVLDAGEPAGAYLGALSVEGFRGIGAQTLLALTPGPGLTLVVGRNRSGKSSLAEALELLLTKQSRRWSERHQVWRESWQNVHHTSGTRIAVDLALEGEAHRAKVAGAWEPGAQPGDGTITVQRHGAKSAPFSTLHWDEALVRYRPFLSYSELGTMFDRGPSSLYDTLALVLGLEELNTAEGVLKQARLVRQRQVDAVTDEAKRLRTRLESIDDERARRGLAALKAKVWRLDELAALLSGDRGGGATPELRLLSGLAELRLPDPDQVAAVVTRLDAAAESLAEVEGTDADRARRTAQLLQAALDLHAAHGDGACPVCGQGALNPEWRLSAEQEVHRLRQEATTAEAANRDAVAAFGSASAITRPVPAELKQASDAGIDATEAVRCWRRWHAATSGDAGGLGAVAGELEASYLEVAVALSEVVAAAAAERDRREDLWSALAPELSAWLAHARGAEQAKAQVANLKAGQQWLATTAGEIRNERFAPLKERALSSWRQLRHHSNVDVEQIVFAGRSTQRRVDLDVSVDGVGAAALGVMSQGELHALALSLFLPRATLPESPSRFLVVDDPVQSMDPARVDGLARVLDAAAQHRQVVVFTHDDRLTDAIRRLGIDARVLQVTRQLGSVMHVGLALDPVTRALRDARDVALTGDLSPEIADRVVPAFCRQALEAAAAELTRRTLLGKGERHQVVEERLQEARTLTHRFALALFGDRARGADVLGRLNKDYGSWAGDVFVIVNKGTHGLAAGDLPRLVDQTKKLAQRVLER